MINSGKLTVLWTSGEKDVATKVVLRYIDNIVEHKSWEHIELIIWGPSVKLAVDDDIRDKLMKLIREDIVVKACQLCAEDYNVSDELQCMGVHLEAIEPELTKIIQDQLPMVSF